MFVYSSIADTPTITGAERPCLDAADNCAAYGTQRISSTGVAIDTPGHAASTADSAPRPALPRLGPSSLQSAIKWSADTTAANEIERQQRTPASSSSHVKPESHQYIGIRDLNISLDNDWQILNLADDIALYTKSFDINSAH
ncbi:hypothetical protein TKK_0016820 [Trichogramma kaykai]|uniref:Uncharacterized protein n=1 Tax=Trichogramma kaykai TaxID=54128 RepID=A0ABD2W4W4_9HYME